MISSCTVEPVQVSVALLAAGICKVAEPFHDVAAQVWPCTFAPWTWRLICKVSVPLILVPFPVQAPPNVVFPVYPVPARVREVAANVVPSNFPLKATLHEAAAQPGVKVQESFHVCPTFAFALLEAEMTFQWTVHA